MTNVQGGNLFPMQYVYLMIALEYLSTIFAHLLCHSKCQYYILNIVASISFQVLVTGKKCFRLMNNK